MYLIYCLVLVYFIKVSCVNKVVSCVYARSGFFSTFPVHVFEKLVSSRLIALIIINRLVSLSLIKYIAECR